MLGMAFLILFHQYRLTNLNVFRKVPLKTMSKAQTGGGRCEGVATEGGLEEATGGGEEEEVDRGEGAQGIGVAISSSDRLVTVETCLTEMAGVVQEVGLKVEPGMSLGLERMGDPEKVVSKGEADIPPGGAVAQGGTEVVVVVVDGGVVDPTLRGQVMDSETTVRQGPVIPMLQSRNVTTEAAVARVAAAAMEEVEEELQTAKTALAATSSRQHHRLQQMAQRVGRPLRLREVVPFLCKMLELVLCTINSLP